MYRGSVGVRASVLSGIAAFMLAAIGAAPSWAAGGMKLCVPKAEGAGLVTPRRGKCKKGYKLTTLSVEGQAGREGKQGAAGQAGPEGKQGPEAKAGFTTEQAEKLKSLLSYVRFVGAGVAGKPTVQFSGVNVQIVNGQGQTESTNGEGNLVIGYDERPGQQTGSHDLILGTEQRFTSYGGIDAGGGNTISEPFASVTGGAGNTASKRYASVSGGERNDANGQYASISGGASNTASGEYASVSGGKENNAKGLYASIFGGHLQEATAEYEAKP